MEAHHISQNEGSAAGRHQPGPSLADHERPAHPSGDVLRRLHDVLFAPTSQELVAPVELKVMGWKTDDRKGVVVKAPAGRAATPSHRRRVPWGAEVEFAYTSGYDSRGRSR